MELLRLLANAGVPAVLLFYVITHTVRSAKQLITAIEAITDRFDRALARHETTVHEVSASVLRLTEELKCHHADLKEALLRLTLRAESFQCANWKPREDRG